MADGVGSRVVTNRPKPGGKKLDFRARDQRVGAIRAVKIYLEFNIACKMSAGKIKIGCGKIGAGKNGAIGCFPREIKCLGTENKIYVALRLEYVHVRVPLRRRDRHYLKNWSLRKRPGHYGDLVSSAMDEY